MEKEDLQHRLYQSESGRENRSHSACFRYKKLKVEVGAYVGLEKLEGVVR